MAGPFTHWMLTEQALAQVGPTELQDLLRNNLNFLLLGSVSPDLPYLSIGSSPWADRFHWEKTNSIPLALLEGITENGGLNKDFNSTLFSWAMGYVSHLVADAYIHPIVEAAVGKLPESKQEHQECEMTQDSILFYKLKNKELTAAEYSNKIKSCNTSPGYQYLMEAWRDFIQLIYNQVDTLHPREWCSGYINEMDVAEGGSLASLSNYLGLGQKLLYRSSKEIISNHPDLFSKYFSEVKLPNESRGEFMKNGFYPAADAISLTWNQTYLGMQSGKNLRNFVKNWNLDTGEDQDSPSKERTFWA